MVVLSVREPEIITFYLTQCFQKRNHVDLKYVEIFINNKQIWNNEIIKITSNKIRRCHVKIFRIKRRINSENNKK